MPDLFHSTKHQLQPERLCISIKLHHGITRAAEYLFNFAHHSRNVSSTFRSHVPKLTMTNPVGNLTTEAIA